jgi:hypothetical protein
MSEEALATDAAAVQEDQGGVGALTTKVGGGGAVVAALGAGHDVGVRRQVVEAVAVDVEVHDQLLGARDALLLHFELGKHGKRQRALIGDALDHRSGDDKLLEFDGLVGRGGGRSGGGLGHGVEAEARRGDNPKPDGSVPQIACVHRHSSS